MKWYAAAATYFFMIFSASANNCLVKHKGKTILEWLPCAYTGTYSKNNPSFTVEQGNFFTARFSKGILYSNVNKAGGPKSDRFTLETFGRAKINDYEDTSCYKTEELELCINFQ